MNYNYLRSIFGALGMRSRLPGLISRPRLAVVPNRKVTDSAGAYLEPPHVNKYAFPQFIMYNIPFMIIGCMIRWDFEITFSLLIYIFSKYGAEFLEEYELFVPDDDDDDD